MRNLIKIILFAVATVSLGSCMQHNGYIGDWFGTWKVESIYVNGEPDTTYAENMFFQFQTDIVRIVEVEDYQNGRSCYGSWEEEGSTLILHFEYTANSNAIFTPLSASYLNRDVNVLEITEKSARKMQWTFDKNDSTTIFYSLKKQ